MCEIAQTHTRVCDFLRLFMSEEQVLTTARILRSVMILLSMLSIIAFVHILLSKAGL